MKINILIFFVLLGGIGIKQAKAQTSSKISLKEAVQYAVEHNTQIANAKLDKQNNYYQIKEATSIGLPQINASSTFDYNARIGSMVLTSEQGTQTIQIGTPYNFNAGVEMKQMIYNQTFWAGLKAIKKSGELYDLQILQTKETVIFEVAKTYYNLQVLVEQKKILQENLLKTEKLLQITRHQFENGMIKKVDYDRVKVSLINIENELESLDADLEAQFQLLKFYMGLPMEQVIMLSDSVDSKQWIAIEELHLAKLTELKILDKQKELEILNAKVTKAGFVPTINAHANYRQNALGNEGRWTWFDASTIGATLTIPIFDGSEKRSKIQQSNTKVKQLDLTTQNTKAQLQMEYTNAVNKLNNRRSVVKKQEANMTLANEVYKTTQDQYKEGVATLSDLLNAESSLKESQTGYLQALIQVKIAELEYLKSNGELETLLAP